MIGAMPALTIRHRREKHDTSGRLRPEKICGKISKTHVVAICALFGMVLLVSALIKVHQGAAVVGGETLALFITSGTFLAMGFILSCIKCSPAAEAETAETQAASVPLSSGAADHEGGKDASENPEQQQQDQEHHGQHQHHHHHHRHHHHHQRASVSEEV